MPDDNTMNILSPHRIPVPQTPTTPGNNNNHVHNHNNNFNFNKGALISSPTPKKQYIHHDHEFENNDNSPSNSSQNYHTPSSQFPDIDKPPQNIKIPQNIPYSNIPSFSNDNEYSNIPSIPCTEYIIKDEEHGRVSAFDLDLDDPKILKKYKITQEKKERFLELKINIFNMKKKKICFFVVYILNTKYKYN